MNSANAVTIGDNCVLTNNLTVTGSGSGTLSLNGQISGAGSLTYSGAGTLSLGTILGNTYSGGTVVDSGTLLLGAAGAIPVNGDVTVASGGTFNTNGLSNGTSVSTFAAIGTLALNGGTFRVPSGSGDYWLNQINTTNGTLDFTGTSGFKLHFKNAGAGIMLNANETWTGVGTVQIRNDSQSPLSISYSGGSIFNAGVIFSGSGSNPNFTFSGNNIRPANTGNTANMNFVGGALFANDISTDVGSGAFGTLGTGIITTTSLYYDGTTATSAKPFTLGGSAQFLVVNGGVNLTLNGAITQTVSGVGLTVRSYLGQAASTLTLTAANSYSGPIVVSVNGILAVPTIGNGGVNSPLGASSNSPANLQLGHDDGLNPPTRGDLLLTGTNATYITDRRATVIGTYPDGGGAIGVQNAGTTLTWNGLITGSGDLIKTGAGTLILGSSANNYTGGTYVVAGTFSLGNGPTVPAGGDGHRFQRSRLQP